MSLILAKNKVNIEQLATVATPERTDTHTPIPHAMLVERTHEALDRAGLQVTQEEHALGRGGQRYFGGFALKGKDMESSDRQLVLGLRNSHDKSFASSVCIGNQMLVCENLCFSSDVKLARRHTLNIVRDLPLVLSSAISRVVSQLVTLYSSFFSAIVVLAESLICSLKLFVPMPRLLSHASQASPTTWARFCMTSARSWSCMFGSCGRLMGFLFQTF